MRSKFEGARLCVIAPAGKQERNQNFAEGGLKPKPSLFVNKQVLLKAYHSLRSGRRSNQPPEAI